MGLIFRLPGRTDIDLYKFWKQKNTILKDEGKIIFPMRSKRSKFAQGAP